MASEKNKQPQSPQEQRRDEIDELMRKYNERLKQTLVTGEEAPATTETQPIRTIEYSEFKKQYMPRHMTWYEAVCQFSEKIIKIAPDQKKLPDYQEAINICHLNVTPAGVMSFAILGPVVLALLGALISLLFGSVFFVLFFVIVGVALLSPLQNYPFFLANTWRMKASNQMVLCIFYVVTYMRHTSNIELAIEFASDHLSPPLSLDMKKVLWDVETEKYESVKESLDMYLDTWRKWNMEFIEAFHLVEGSLYEGSEDRRLSMLEKALSTILDETYEKMLHYAQNLKSPITMLHMLGVILPILGLVILPLVVSFMCQVQWYHLAALYNIILPISVYYLGKTILASRPTGYGDTDIAETNPQLRKFRNFILKIGKTEIAIKPVYISVIIGVLFLLIGISPLLLNGLVGKTNWDIILDNDNNIKRVFELENRDEKFSLLGYKNSKGCPPGEEGAGERIGPFGLGAGLLSLSLVLSLGLSIGIYHKIRSQNVIKIREESKKLEDEFASALFQLGNRLGDGLPAEIAFGKVAEVMEGTISGEFFRLVSSNITRMGMSVNEAIFHPDHGALVYYPSAIIESSMKVLTESAKKGPKIAAEAVINVSRYIKEIHRVNERLKDLMADVISSMKSQISFLTPVIAGIVIGITSMITTILGKLGVQIRNITAQSGGAAAGGATGLVGLFGDGVPTYYFQIMVGLYVVQIVYILTILTNGIENGADKLNERYSLGVNMIKSTILYVLVSFGVILLFNIIAGSIIGRISLG
ncbi:hypothetical protein HY488_00705 [Candidatus Woesearchaeota archaeon]|nr:hypothetical protein [Candidatus Woesearchaeota archaeon]